MQIYFLDNNEKILNIPKIIINAWIDEKINTPKQIILELQKDTDIKGALYILYVQDNIAYQFRVHKTNKTNEKLTILGIESAYDELQTSNIIRDKRLKNYNTNEAFKVALEGTRYSLGAIKSQKVINTNFYYLTNLEAINKLIDDYSFEIKFRLEFRENEIVGRYLDVYEHYSQDYGKRFEHGSNLLTVEQEGDLSKVYTALIGRGKGEQTENGGFGRKLSFKDVTWTDPVNKPFGQDYVEIQEATDIFGFRIGIVEFNDEDDPNKLLERTYQELLTTCYPQTVYKSTILNTGKIELGEVISIVHKELNILYKSRVTRVQHNLLDISKTEVEIGGKISSYSAEKLKELDRKIEVESQERIGAYESIVKTVNSDYWSNDAYVYNFLSDNKYNLPSGVYGFNKPIDQNPTEAIYIGGGKLLISNSKDENNNWKWTTAIDGKGLGTNLIGAEQIKSGSIKADHIESGAISADKINVGDDSAKATLEEFLNQLNANNGDLAKRLEQSTNALSNAENKLNELEESYKQTLLSNEATEAEINNQLASLEEARAEMKQAQEETKANLQEVEELAKAVTRTFNTDSLGRPVISKADSDVKLVLDNDKLSFVSQGSELAYFGKDKAYISALQILQNLNIGKYTFEVEADGGFSIRWID